MTAQWKTYDVVFGPEALSRLPGVVPLGYMDCIERNFTTLRGDPTNLAERCPHPYPGTKAYQFECLEGERGFIFRAHFFFNPEETQICIFDVTVVASF